ncbi:neurotransmitter-gated ion-channel ligand binding domain-containing protein [Ditylenchus destructor]|uniref:Ligand-gated ion channel 4 n=1 Tax=Ditylenchus destructor TaxID=166010 RepID=A0AAD4N9L4_9BILA|nr:neurotransmitter-gated ion-channel ligand binding domain-containing protein [Ditylenchus destructor]
MLLTLPLVTILLTKNSLSVRNASAENETMRGFDESPNGEIMLPSKEESYQQKGSVVDSAKPEIKRQNRKKLSKDSREHLRNAPSLRFLESLLSLNPKMTYLMDEDVEQIDIDFSNKSANATDSKSIAESNAILENMATRTEEYLYRKLLNPEYYEKHVRPTRHHSLATNITFGVLLNQIVEMDERNQVLTTRCWINANWMDPRLTWNESEWDNIKQIYVPHQKIWKPDVILVNNAAREYHSSVLSTDIMVTNEGNVTWLFSALFKSNCAIKVRYYPFDDQECSLKFASWGSRIDDIDIGLTTEKGDLSNYMNNSEFDLIDMRAMRTVIRFPTDVNNSWPMIVILIRMHRRPLFYVFNHILPCVLISSMALLGFFMPPETGEKINMLNTVILSMGVYLQSITESIPPTSEAVPLIGMYYVASLFIVCMATTVNVVTLNIHRSGAANQGRHVPLWMEKYILGWMATILLLRIHEPDSITLLKTSQAKQSTIRRSSLLRDLKRIKNTENRKGANAQRRQICECLMPSSPRAIIGHENDNNYAALEQGSPRLVSTGESAFLGRVVKEQLMPRISTNTKSPPMLAEFEERFRRILKRIYRSLQQHEIREEIMDERKRIQWQWQALASVIDRFLLILFTMATLATVLFFLVLPVTFRDQMGNPLFL